MKLSLITLSILALASCAHLPGRAGAAEASARAELWHDAHMALYAENFARADTIFSRLSVEHAASEEGREAHFYLGALQIDPRNREWNSERAETSLRRYLQQDTVGTLIHRRPEATTLLEIAKQINLPPGQRISALQPGTAPAPAGQQQTPPRTVASGAQLRAIQEENESLRRQLAERDDQIRRQREELDRIRRALTPRN